MQREPIEGKATHSQDFLQRPGTRSNIQGLAEQAETATNQHIGSACERFWVNGRVWSYDVLCLLTPTRSSHNRPRT